MANNATIENFIKKVRLAETTKSKDLRLTIEEARDLVASIALINTGGDAVEQLSKKMDKIIKKIDERPVTLSPHIDGGGFKE